MMMSLAKGVVSRRSMEWWLFCCQQYLNEGTCVCVSLHVSVSVHICVCEGVHEDGRLA